MRTFDAFQSLEHVLGTRGRASTFIWTNMTWEIDPSNTTGTAIHSIGHPWAR